MLREIPKLQILCLRSVGAHSCSAEDTFAFNQQTGEPSKSSQLLRKFHKRPVAVDSEEEQAILAGLSSSSEDEKPIDNVPMARACLVGKGSSRRAQANDVDLNHPLLAHNYQGKSTTTEVKASSNNNGDNNADTITTPGNKTLVMEYGSPALETLQSYIDSLVELGRMDDGRLGIHFFQEWKANVLVAAGKPVEPPKPKKASSVEGEQEDSSAVAAVAAGKDTATSPPPRKRSRRRSSGASSAADNNSTAAANNNATNTNATGSTTTLRLSVKQGPPPPLGSLSLNNCALAEETVEAMRDSNMGIHIGVLDMTGIYQLNDTMLEQLLPHCPNLKRFSIKNCRRVTAASLQILAQYQTKLVFLDIGGTYNITPQQVLDILMVGEGKNMPCPELTEMHASGLGWNDSLLKALVHGTNSTASHDDDDDEEEQSHQQENRRAWKALSVGFSYSLTSLALRKSLSSISDTLVSLALHFCEHVVDNALMGILGRNLPHVTKLDVRGNPSLSSMTGWYDGRASADFHIVEDEDGNTTSSAVQELLVLARFTGISKASLEETVRIHPLQATKLTCILDGGGQGLGVFR